MVEDIINATLSALTRLIFESRTNPGVADFKRDRKLSWYFLTVAVNSAVAEAIATSVLVRSAGDGGHAAACAKVCGAFGISFVCLVFNASRIITGGFGVEVFAGVVARAPCPDNSVQDFQAEQEQDRERGRVVLALSGDGSTLPSLFMGVMHSKFLVYCLWKSCGSIAVRSL